jgi:hypothetical protein
VNVFAFDIMQSVEKGVPYDTRDKSVGVLPLSPGVDSRPDHVAFIPDKVAMVQVSLRVFHLFSTGVFPSVLRTVSFVYHLRHNFLTTELIDNTPSM